jgi:NAD(P)-dependent dehydrogenase (short-subunit alcohol dehydrogenase family)
MKENFEHKVVVVTGASAGVGRAAAVEFASRGAAVALLARSEERLDDAAREVESVGGRPLVIQLDVANAEAVEQAAEQVERELGPIDVWVNNAMVSVVGPFCETTPDEFKRVTEVTYLGYVYGTMAALKRMLPRDEGVIVQVGSALAYRSIPLQSAYCGAKHAIRGFTDSIRSELIHDGSKVKLTAVHLPAVNTPQFEWVRNRMPNKTQPVPPVYQPEVAADAIAFAALHPRREFFLGMSSWKAIVGNKFFPGLLDRYLAKQAYQGQQEDGAPAVPGRADNLYQTAPGRWGARGRFDEESTEWSPQFEISRRRGTVAAATLGLVAAGIASIAMFGSKQEKRKFFS